MLHLTSTALGEDATHDLIVLAQDVHEHLIAELLRQARRAAEIGEQDGADGRFSVCLARRVMREVTEERVHRPRAHFDDIFCHEAVSIPVHCFYSRPVRPFSQTEDGPRIVVEPISDVPHAIAVLDGKVELVRGCEIGGGRAADIMAVKEQRHVGPLCPAPRLAGS